MPVSVSSALRHSLSILAAGPSPASSLEPGDEATVAGDLDLAAGTWSTCARAAMLQSSTARACDKHITHAHA